MPARATRRYAVRPRPLALVMAVLVASSPALFARPAAAEPGTPVAYPLRSSATRTTGPAFDTCTAPSIAALQAWSASPFRTVNTYFGGANRGCAQPNLTSTWVAQVAALRWRILPTYFGAQPACTTSSKPVRYSAAQAAAVGSADGFDAVQQAWRLGMKPGSALYADVEPYTVTDAACVASVRSYVSAYVKRLHSYGYLAGVYVAQNSGALHLAQSYSSASYARPDAVWLARWDLSPSLTGWVTVSNDKWAVHQRAKQYRGDHSETWGGVTMRIDSDQIDGPVATLAYPYRVRDTTSTIARTGPAPTYPAVRAYAPGSALAVLCQATGAKVGTSTVWNRISDGSFVNDYAVTTPSKTGFSAPLPRCSYPGQVLATDGLNARTGPGTSFPVLGTPLPPGALAWTLCQRLVGSTVWDRIDDGRWVSDAFVAHTGAAPRC